MSRNPPTQAAEIVRDPHPWIQAYFHGDRARLRAQEVARGA